MGCIQTKKLIKICNSSQNDGSKNESNNIAIHNIRKDTTNNNESVKSNNMNNDKNDKMIHSNSQTFKIKSPMNDNQSKSNYSKKNSSFYNRSISNSEENDDIFKLTSNVNNDILNQDIKFEDKYAIVKEENYESYFKTYKIKLKDENYAKEEYRSMIKIEKEIFGEFASDKKIAEEVSLLSKLDSKYIIKVYECFISNKRYYLITDYCEFGSLNELLRKGNLYSENQIRYLVLQIFKAIKYLNSNNYLHIEISPEKILINNITKDSHGEELYNIKLLDFFCPSRNNILGDNKSSFFFYMAPEVLEQKYSPTCDIWSIGIIIFQMFFGELPCKESNDFKEYVKNIKSTYSYCDNISNEFKDLLDKMLNKNPSRRITIDECLAHPWVHKQNTEIITEEEELNKQQQILRTKTKQSKLDKKKRKSHKSGKITNIESKKMIYYSENNSYKTNLIEVPFHRNSSSIVSDSNSNDNDNNNEINRDMNITNESTRERIKINSYNNLNNLSINLSKKNNDYADISPKNNEHFKSEYEQKIENGNSKKNLKRISSLSADKKIEVQKIKKFPPLIEKTLEYIKYYICLNYHKKKEKDKITKIFNELDSQKNNYLLHNKVYFACASYKDNKNISLQSLNNFDDNTNNNKRYTLEEFINILIEEKTKYINDNFKNIFNSIKQPNIDEIIKIYKDQEPIDEYKKYIKYIKELVKIVQENNIKTNYLFNEFIKILDNVIDKLYKSIFISKLEKIQNKDKLGRTYTKKIIYNKNTRKNPVKRSNTYLKAHQKMVDKNNKTIIKNNKENNKIELSRSIICHLEIPEFNPEHFLSLTKK